MTNSAKPSKSAPVNNANQKHSTINMPKPDLLAIEIYDSLKKQMSSPMLQGKLFFLSKVLLVLACYIFLALNSIHDYVSPDLVPECIQDKMQDATLPLNQHLAANPTHKNALIIFASFMIDANVFVMATRWIIFGKNFKTFMTIFLFYALRGFMQTVFFMRYPTDYIWGHPGMFSVAVPYQPANDFFFSGHVGLCVICFIDFKRENVRFMKEFAFISIIVEFFTLLVTRAHYFIDLFTGLIVAHYIYLVSDWVYAYYQKKQDRKKKKVGNTEGQSTRRGSEINSTPKDRKEKVSLNNKRTKKAGI